MRKLILILILGTGCGEPLVGSDYIGTPELSVRGTVQQISGRIPADHGDLALGVFWIGTSSGAAAGVEQDAHLDAGLGAYTMRLFDAPPESALHFSAIAGDAPLGLGVVALYADQNHSGAFEPEGDLLLGASPQHLVVFAARALPGSSPAAALLGEISAGYHLFVHDRTSTCRFIAAERCAAEGGLSEVAADASVPLTLWDDPMMVVVPAPKLPSGASVWSPR
ncbi:MAG: hypothetical protein U1E65_15850 [Myxococcota bacterium]